MGFTYVFLPFIHMEDVFTLEMRSGDNEEGWFN